MSSVATVRQPRGLGERSCDEAMGQHPGRERARAILARLLELSEADDALAAERRRLVAELSEASGWAVEPHDELLCAKKAAELLGVSRDTVVRLAIDRPDIGGKLGGAWRFSRSRLLAYKASLLHPPPA